MARGLPSDFSFPGMTSEIAIEPASRRFESWGDLPRWAWHSVGAWIRNPFRKKAPFRFEPAYAVDHVLAPGATTFAFFSDFGTGLYYSRYIAKQIEHFAPDYAFHLGDVYYTGTAREFDTRFANVLAPLLDTSRVFALNANHEMMSRGGPYFHYLDRKRAHAGPVPQEQETSVFCVSGDAMQIVGIDTAYHDDGHFPDATLRAWLWARLEQGRAAGKRNVLLSANEPYRLGEGEVKPLLAEDLNGIGELVDLWFWGNQHHCALHDRTSALPFYGSCVGHAGHPNRRLTRADGDGSAAPVLWLEDAPRFPPDTGLRQDQGNPGFALLHCPPDGAWRLQYWDWRRELRHEVALFGA